MVSSHGGQGGHAGRLATLAVCVGLVAATLGCSSGEEVTSTGGPSIPGSTVLRFAGTSIVAEAAGADAATAVGGLIGPPPTPSTTTTSTTTPPSTPAPTVSTPPVTTPQITLPPVTQPQPQQTVTYTIAPPVTPAPTLPPTTIPSKPPPIPLDPNSLTPDEKLVLAKINAKKGGTPLILEQAATATAKQGAIKIVQTGGPYSFPGSIFEFVNASYSQLTTGTFYATTIELTAESAAAQLAPSLGGLKYIGLSVVTLNNNPWVLIILGS